MRKEATIEQWKALYEAATRIKEIRVSNILVEAGLEQICQTCGIKLRRVKKLHAIEEFREGMRQVMAN